MSVTVKEEGRAVVVYEPRGDFGLEGFFLRGDVKYQRVCNGVKEYYRVWRLDWEKEKYYETCSIQGFNKCFERVCNKVAV